MCFQTQTVKHRETNEHKHLNDNALVHIRYTIFSSCFSSAFPNGWLNQLCGARFKSSGMLGYCQWLVRQPGGSRVTGGEQLTSSYAFIKIFIYQEKSGINGAKNKFLSRCSPAYTHTVHSDRGNAAKPPPKNTQWSTINILRHTKQLTESPSHLQSHTVVISPRKLNGKFNRKLQSTLQPYYEEEIIQNGKVRNFNGISLSFPSRGTLVKINESILTGGFFVINY